MKELFLATQRGPCKGCRQQDQNDDERSQDDAMIDGIIIATHMYCRRTGAAPAPVTASTGAGAAASCQEERYETQYDQQRYELLHGVHSPLMYGS